MILFGVMLFVGINTRNWIAREVQQWTVSEPININLPVVNVPDSELETFKVQVKNFINQGGDSDSVDSVDLEVPARTVNGLVSASDFLHGNAYVNVCCNKTRILVSLHWIYTLLTRACFQECMVQSSYENTQHKLYKVGQI